MIEDHKGGLTKKSFGIPWSRGKAEMDQRTSFGAKKGTLVALVGDNRFHQEGAKVGPENGS
jgi:hypothetical protein